MSLELLNQYQINEAVQSALNELEFVYTYDEENCAFHFVLPLEGPVSFLKVTIRTRETDFYVVSKLPLRGDANDKWQIAELVRLVAIINYGKVHGSFNIDVDDGELNFRTSCQTLGLNSLSTAAILYHLALSSQMWKENVPLFIDVLFKKISADEAVELNS